VRFLILALRRATPFDDSARLVRCLALVAALALFPACRSVTPSPPVDPDLVTVEPPGAAAFLAALAQGDEATAEGVASPLYRAEWERRGLTIADRRALHAGPPPWIAFAFVGGVVDQADFGHYLYLASPPAGQHPPSDAPSVWRVDVDPQGEVIWAEVVHRFGSGAAAAVTLGDGSASSAPVPAALQSLQPDSLVRIQSTATPESYNLVRVRPPHLTALQTRRLHQGDGGGNVIRASQSEPTIPIDGQGDALAFYAVDDDGGFRPGAWSYGQPTGTTLSPGQGPPPTSGLDPVLFQLQEAYLAALAGGP
jgi:hypothetical protein